MILPSRRASIIFCISSSSMGHSGGSVVTCVGRLGVGGAARLAHHYCQWAGWLEACNGCGPEMAERKILGGLVVIYHSAGSCFFFVWSASTVQSARRFF